MMVPPFSLSQADKERLLLPQLMELTERHRQSCADYARLLRVLHPPSTAASRSALSPPPQLGSAHNLLAGLPFLPVGLFKSHRLKSVADAKVVRELHSSSTTGQAPSRVFLDAETARLQSLALVRIMAHVLGPKRLPMLVCDHSQVVARGALSARGAGVLGMMNFGQRPTFALHQDMAPDLPAIDEFCRRVGDGPCLLFGFTYIIWRHLVCALEAGRVCLPGGILVHSGGWKKMQAEAVDNPHFKKTVSQILGIPRCVNFYGMVEQVGSVCIEGDDGFLYPPAFADVLVRRPQSLELAAPGEAGVLQVLSILPQSYPGHSLLTEDWGVIEGQQSGHLGGRAFRVLGRVPRAEPRGCGDLSG